MKNVKFKNFIFKKGEKNGKDVIWIKPRTHHHTIEDIRPYLKLYYSATQKSWYFYDLPQHRKIVGFDVHPFSAADELPALHKEAFDRYIQELQLKAYSKNTIRTYASEIIPFFKTFSQYHPEEITEDLIRRYLVYCSVELKLSEFSINSRMNAIKFYFEKVLHQDKVLYHIPRPKKPLVLPKVLSVREVRALFNAVQNEKHLIILKTIYGMGLRVSEVVNLKIADLDSERMLVHIKGAKGKKDRISVLPESLLHSLREYYKVYKPMIYLFENRFGQQLNVRTIQAIFKTALRKTNTKKDLGVHCLRHSFATHLLESGTDVALIQQLLGHNNIKTTLAYTHVSKKSILKIISPLDQMNL